MTTEQTERLLVAIEKAAEGLAGISWQLYVLNGGSAQESGAADRIESGLRYVGDCVTDSGSRS